MIQQVYIDSRYADYSFPDGSLVFWLSDPIIAPPGHWLNARVIDAWIPVSFYNIFESNNTLVVDYGAEQQTIVIPPGNRDIDYMITRLNDELLYGWQLTYDTQTNRVAIDGGTGDQPTIIGDYRPLGFRSGDTQASDVVNLTRTSCLYVRSNMVASNRDPVQKRASHLLAKVPVAFAQPNEIIEHSQTVHVRLTDRSVAFIQIQIVDDSFRPIDFQGVPWSMTLQFTLEKDETYVHNMPRYLADQEEPKEPKSETRPSSSG